MGKEREGNGVTSSFWEGSSLGQGVLVSPAQLGTGAWFGYWGWWGRRLESWSPQKYSSPFSSPGAPHGRSPPLSPQSAQGSYAPAWDKSSSSSQGRALSLCPPLLFQNPSKASQSSRDTLSSGVHSWGSQAEARSSSWNMVLARGRPTDTPSYFNGTVQHPPAQQP